MEDLLTECTGVDIRLADLDIRELQVRFAELFDRAAMKLCPTGLDLDDVVFDRVLVCDADGTRIEVPADWLSDRQRLMDQLSIKLSASGITWDPLKIRIVELMVVVRRGLC